MRALKTQAPGKGSCTYAFSDSLGLEEMPHALEVGVYHLCFLMNMCCFSGKVDVERRQAITNLLDKTDHIVQIASLRLKDTSEIWVLSHQYYQISDVFISTLLFDQCVIERQQ